MISSNSIAIKKNRLTHFDYMVAEQSIGSRFNGTFWQSYVTISFVQDIQSKANYRKTFLLSSGLFTSI